MKSFKNRFKLVNVYLISGEGIFLSLRSKEETTEEKRSMCTTLHREKEGEKAMRRAFLAIKIHAAEEMA